MREDLEHFVSDWETRRKRRNQPISNSQDLWERINALVRSTALTLLGTLVALPAFASTGNVFMAGDTVYVHGLTQGDSVLVGIPKAASRKLRANYCGVVGVKPSERYPQQTVEINGITLDDSLPLLNVTCRERSLDPPQSSPWQDNEGNYYLPGQSVGIYYQVNYPNQAQTKTRKVNECGYISIAKASQYGDGLVLPDNAGNMAYFELANLPQGNRYYCRESVESISKVFYKVTGENYTANSSVMPQLFANNNNQGNQFVSPIPSSFMACIINRPIPNISGSAVTIWYDARAWGSGTIVLENWELDPSRTQSKSIDSNGFVKFENFWIDGDSAEDNLYIQKPDNTYDGFETGLSQGQTKDASNWGIPGLSIIKHIPDCL